METVTIHSLRGETPQMKSRLRAAQMESARLWNDVKEFHVFRRTTNGEWPTQDDLQKHTKGRYALHSQSIQMVCHQLLANVDATDERRRNEPESRKWLKYPYRDKNYFPVYWPAQAASYDAADKRLVLPMGRGRKSLVFKLDLEFEPGGVKLVWNEGYELHIVRTDIVQAEAAPGGNIACIDPGEIHQFAVVTNTGEAVVVSGRGIRSQKRLLSKQLGEIARKRSRCKKGSRQSLKLQKARQKRSLLSSRRIRDLRHKGTRKAIKFCEDNNVGTLHVGDPRGVREKDSGRHQNQRMARWEIGKDIDYLKHKSEQARIACSTVNERGTSSRCPECGNRQKVTGRVWRCRAAGCGFVGHRDVVGGVNMHGNAYGAKVTFPAQVTYLRPGPERAARGLNSLKPVRKPPERSSSSDTSLREARLPLSPQLPTTSLPQGGASGSRQATVSPQPPGPPTARRKVLLQAA